MDRRAGKESSIKVSNKTAPPRPAPRLYLATPVIADAAMLAAQLPGLLAQADVAAVLVRLKETDPRSMISVIKALAPAIQSSGAALLIDGHADLVARSGADGAHLNGIAALDEALPTLKPDRIAGERGADYVLFGEPDAHGSRPSTDAIAERLGWWAELFEPPCIGYAATREEAAEFVAAGADFILADDLVWTDARGPAPALAELGAAIKAAYTAAGHG
jgi:thiamine-phosphate pyrophosphorylase